MNLADLEMTIQAEFQTNYLYRYLIMALVCLGGAAWFGYDGFIGYPAKLPAAEAYEELTKIEDPVKRETDWTRLVEQNGWETPSKTSEKIRAEIQGQFVYMVVGLLAGIPAVLYFFSCRGSWIESTEAGLTTSWGQDVDFEKVTELDKRKWAKKGIAKAHYDDNGQKKVFVFDDFKYQRDELGEILRSLESMLDRELITGGLTEEETDREKKHESEMYDEESEAGEAESLS